MAYAKGAASGAAGAAVDNMRGMRDAQIQYTRLLSGPLDYLFSPPGQSAAEQLGRGAQNGLAAGLYELLHPGKLRSDATGWVHGVAAGLNPVSDAAATPEQQKQRAYEAGANAGADLLNAATVLDAPIELKYLGELGHLGTAPTVETYIARGDPPNIARHFAGPYTGREGSHFIPQRTGLPKWFLDSPFNRVMPAPGATSGQAAEFHFRADNKYNGGRIRGGGGWSGKRLGWVKPPAPMRWWRGMPLPTKMLGYGALAGLGSLATQHRPDARK